MEKSNKITDIKKIIDKILNNSRYSGDLKLHKIKKEWKKIVGDQLYSNTEPLKIINSKLIIKCNHQGWISTLQFYKKDIISKIKKEFKENIVINDIDFIFKSKF